MVTHLHNSGPANPGKTTRRRRARRGRGRPRKYATPRALEAKVDAYFDQCRNATREVVNLKTGQVRRIADPKPPTLTGLLLFLGFSRRQALSDYEKRPEYCDIIKKARCTVLADLETRLIDGTGHSPGVIWILKRHYGWHD